MGRDSRLERDSLDQTQHHVLTNPHKRLEARGREFAADSGDGDLMGDQHEMADSARGMRGYSNFTGD